MTISELKTLINTYIKTNGNREITGTVLNNVLIEVANTMQSNGTKIVVSETQPVVGISVGTTWIKTSTNQIFQYNGTTWDLALDASELLSQLSDVDIDTPLTGEALVYNEGTSKWENTDLTSTIEGIASGLDATVLQDAKDYTDSAVTNIYRLRGNYDASLAVFPSTGGSGVAGAVRAGDTWNISVGGTIAGEIFAVGDRLTALIDTPGQTLSNWQRGEKNDEQATELTLGLAKLSTQAIIEDETTTNDIDIVTPKKFWQGLGRLKSGVANVWSLLQTFTLAPKLSSLLSKNVLGTSSDGTIQQASLTQNYIWLGNGSNIPAETSLDNISRIKTIGTNGVYATLEDFINNATDSYGILISNVTLGATCTATTHKKIINPYGYTIDSVDYNVNLAVGKIFEIDNCIWRWRNPTTAAIVMANDGLNTNIILKGLASLTSYSTSNSHPFCYFHTYGTLLFDNIILVAANYHTCGLYSTSTETTNVRGNSIKLSGGGTSCYNLIQGGLSIDGTRISRHKINHIELIGTYNTSNYAVSYIESDLIESLVNCNVLCFRSYVKKIMIPSGTAGFYLPAKISESIIGTMTYTEPVNQILDIELVNTEITTLARNNTLATGKITAIGCKLPSVTLTRDNSFPHRNSGSRFIATTINGNLGYFNRNNDEDLTDIHFGEGTVISGTMIVCGKRWGVKCKTTGTITINECKIAGNDGHNIDGCYVGTSGGLDTIVIGANVDACNIVNNHVALTTGSPATASITNNSGTFTNNIQNTQIL